MARKKTPRPLYGHHFLREWREDREMTLEEAGEAVGISHAQLGRIERRLQKYNQELLESLAALYETTAAALIERHPKDRDIWRQIDDYANFLRPKEPS